jgi:glycolate oxidase
MSAVAAVSDPLLAELRQILGEEGVLTSKTARYNRTRVPAPFPVHRWSELVPDVVVLPTTAEQVSAVVRLANHFRIPVVPRAGGTGLNDGAVPLKRGIVVDVKRMNQIKEIDLVDRTVTVGPGINMLKLNEVLRKHGVIYPDDPASYPCSLVGGRIGTSGWSLLGSRYGHTRDLVISFQMVLPTGEIVEFGDGGGRKVRKSSTGFQLKHLFMGHQGTLGIVTEATLELVPRPEVEFAAFFAYDSFDAAYRSVGAMTKSGLATLAGVVLFDEYKLRYLRRDDEAYIPQPESVKAVVATAMYGSEDETVPAARRLFRIGKETGGRYLGDELSQGDWASRHDRYATPLHGRLRSSGQVAPMSWHCEDASINYSKLPDVMKAWHRIADELIERHEIFDDWGMFFYTNGAYKPWGDYLTEIDIGIWEQRLDDTNWAAWVQAKKEIAAVSLALGGSMTACHGATRAGEVELVPEEMGGGFDVMLKIKRALDPNNIMNPGKYELDRAYADPDVEVVS